MSLQMTLQAASDDKINEFSRDSAALNRFVALSGGAASGANAAVMQNILSNVASNNPRLNMIVDVLGLKKKFEQRGLSLDLEGGYQGLHYLFTGSPEHGAEPFCYLMHGGKTIGLFEQEFEVRAINCRQLAAFEQAIEPIDKQELMRRYNGKAMIEAGIYPSGLWAHPGNDGREYLCQKLVDLKEFLRQAKALNEGMVMCVR